MTAFSGFKQWMRVPRRGQAVSTYLMEWTCAPCGRYWGVIQKRKKIHQVFRPQGVGFLVQFVFGSDSHTFRPGRCRRLLFQPPSRQSRLSSRLPNLDRAQVFGTTAVSHAIHVCVRTKQAGHVLASSRGMAGIWGRLVVGRCLGRYLLEVGWWWIGALCSRSRAFHFMFPFYCSPPLTCTQNVPFSLDPTRRRSFNATSQTSL